jgi:hypothetical protein
MRGEQARKEILGRVNQNPKEEEEILMIQAAAIPAKRSRKDLLHIQCFKCKEYGHYSTSKLCPMNKKKQATENSQDRATFANAMW